MSYLLSRWVSSGAASLTGRHGGAALGPPGGLAALLDALAPAPPVDPWQLLVERAAARGWTRNGDVSCGSATRLLAAADGWVAISLARPEDFELVPAWLELDRTTGDVWDVVALEVNRREVRELDTRAALVGLPFGVVPAAACVPASSTPSPFGGLPVRAVGFGPTDRVRREHPVVVDLSSLWAGPLCTRLLVHGGFRVIKVESTGRADSVRIGDPEFFNVLHAGKESVALDFDDPVGRSRLRRLVSAADIVVEASRPRALRQLGINAEQLLTDVQGPAVWVSITARGRTGVDADRVAFGDDAAAAAGLVVTDTVGPCFCVDAIADPLSGMVAASAVRRAWRDDRRWLIDVAMVDAAAAATGPTVPLSVDVETPPPQPTTPSGPAASLGANTEDVVAELAAP